MRAAAMSLTATTRGFVVLLLTVTVISQDDWNVTYSSTQICTLKGSTVEMHCSYRYPFEKDGQKTRVRSGFWFSKDSNNIYVDLRTDPEYSGRVQYHYGNNSCTLRITDLRKSDSAEYKFRFTTNQPGGSVTGSPGVTLSVADLQVNRSQINLYSVELKCQSSCPLAEPQSYIWYSKGRSIDGETSQFYRSYFYRPSRISCAVNGHENSPSPSVLVKDAWDVTYSSTQICAFKGSTVEMHCSYTHPPGIHVTEMFWFTKAKDDEYVKLKDDPQYADRVEYDQKSCSLTIRNLTESDSAEYKFRFKTNQQGGKYSGSPGVTLSVKDPQLQVHVSRSVNRFPTWTELTCQSSCQRPDYPSYNWYNNNVKVLEGKTYLHLQAFGPSDSYYCAVQGQEHFRSHAVYAPKLSSVSVSPSAEIVEGSSVNLTCSSDANPAANYTWYKENQDSPKASGHIFTITDFRAEHSGYYSCEAQNIVGRHTVSVHVAVLGGSWKAAAVGATTAVTLLVVFLLVFIMMRKKRRSEQSADPVQRADNREQDDLHYASIQFSKNLQESLYSNTASAEPQRHVEKEDEGVVYSGVRCNSGIRGQETEEDAAALYSTVKKTR
uniref:B-cell receptor CD22 n=1 Tax=Amphiprion percula TaxID=161767 RepID=A0A3P8STU7_AMPPE